MSSAVRLQQDGAFLTATTTDTFGLTDQSFFNMPARTVDGIIASVAGAAAAVAEETSN